ncbi:hypothetical protein Syun_009816 [Stephania yunnanensis]|uniref:Ribosomal protein S21 n=1 Tax=Stephania yunnanensis TaxID=152371 RepID=A0AAP0PPE0_9MAGN
MASSSAFLQLRFSQNPKFTLSNSSARSPPLLRLSFNSTHKTKSTSPIAAKQVSNSDQDWVDSVANPSLKYANVMFFKSAYNVQIMVEEEEPDEALLRRFRREVSKAGVIQECKRRRFFENKQEEKKRKAREAGRRNRRRRLGPRFSGPPRGETAPPKKADEDDDNWDMPEDDLPL